MRKVRSDKKRDVRPTVSIYIKRNLQTLKRITGLSLQDVSLTLVQNAICNDDVLRELQPFMLSNFVIENRVYIGGREGEPIKMNYRGETGKVPVKVPNRLDKDLRRLAYSIGLTPTSTTALLIRKAMFNETFMESHKYLYLQHIEDREQVEDLEYFFKGLKGTRR